MDDVLLIAGGNVESSVEEHREESTPLITESDQCEALKKLGNVARYELDQNALYDRFEVGAEMLKNIVEERGKERDLEQKKIELIYDAVRYHKKNMARIAQEIRDTIKLDNQSGEVDDSDWERELGDLLTEFNDEEYLKDNSWYAFLSLL